MPRSPDRAAIHALYTERKTVRLTASARLRIIDGRIAHARFAVFLSVFVLAYLAFGARWFSGWWITAPVPLFFFLVAWHERVARRAEDATQGAAYYDRGLARLEDRFTGVGPTGDRYASETHPSAQDLDLFGNGSLYQLLCCAKTKQGEDLLAQWLLAPTPADAARERRHAIEELCPKVDLREELYLIGGSIPDGIDLTRLVHWALEPTILTGFWTPWIARLLATAAFMALLGWFTGDWGGLPFAVILLIEAAFSWRLRSDVNRVLDPVESRSRELSVFARILSRIENEKFTSARLLELHALLRTEGKPPSARIRELGDMIDWLNARRNQFFALLAPVLLWGTQWAYAIEKLRRVIGPAVPRWLDAVAEFEALSSLAAFTYENPDYPFPEWSTDSPCLVAEDLGHPLVPRAKNVRNSVAFSASKRLFVVSGSNMSGKSTLLRSVGINVVLAQAGAPVRASLLRLSPLVVGATLRVQDSLQAGRSRFYAEVLRVKQIVELARENCVLFLLDELLQGTNSHDRRLGSDAIIKQLLDHGAIGFVTTHDLALAEIADRLSDIAANVHFEDQFEEGEMLFDYRMRPGVVRKSNALALMRVVGIDVSSAPASGESKSPSDSKPDPVR